MTSAVSVSMNRKEKLNALLQSMQQGLLEREEQVKLTLLAALAGEHVLLLGPPGTAKSELAKRLKDVFVEASYFERLLTRFSVPEEIFGPLSIKALEEDRYTRMTSGYLPEASVAFIDEIFKANSAILNSMLSVLNERVFDNGISRGEVPLVSVIAASNELPEGDDLSALYDRFMLRSYVEPVSDDSFNTLLMLGDEKCDPDLSIRLRVEELKEVKKLARKVAITPDVIELCNLFRGYLKDNEIKVSDRRWLKIIKLLQVSAFTNEQNEVSVYDAWLLPHCLWEKPEQLAGLSEFYKENITLTGDFNKKALSQHVLAWEGRVKELAASKQQVLDKKGRPLFINENGNRVLSSSRQEQKLNSDGRPVFLSEERKETTNSYSRYGEDPKPIMVSVDNEPVQEPEIFSEARIAQYLGQFSRVHNDVSIYLEQLQDRLRQDELILNNHLWVDTNIWREASAGLTEAIEAAEKLLIRCDNVVSEFDRLPREDLDAIAPVIEGELVEVECDD